MSTGIRIADLPDLGSVTSASSLVGEKSGSGTFTANALRSYCSGGAVAIGSDVTDMGAAITSAIATLPSSGGVVLLPPGDYNQSTAVVIIRNNIRIIGAGSGTFHNIAPFWTPGATNITWTGVNGGTMITIAAQAGGQRLVGCEVSGVALIAGVLPFTTAAAVGLLVQSHASGKFDLTTFEFSSVHVNFSITGALTEGANNEGNEIRLKYRALSNAGTVLRLGGLDTVGNSAMNYISYIGGEFYNGNVIDWVDADNNRADMVVAYRAAGGTGYGMVYRGGHGATGGFARQNKVDWYTAQTSGAPILVEGTGTSGVTQASVENQILFFDNGNDLPNITTGTGCSFWYGNDRMPVGRIHENVGLSYPFAGATVTTSRLGDVWGVVTAGGAGTSVVAVNSMGNTPIVGAMNVQVTPLQGGTTHYISAIALNSFSLTVSGAGTFFWRAVVV